MPKNSDHIAIYGSTRINRAWCKDCEGYAFVVRDRIACCDTPYKHNPDHYQRMLTSEERGKPSMAHSKLQLVEQDNLCLYCDRFFGSEILIGNKIHIIKVNWDHFVPLSYSGNNLNNNFVAACQFCNKWKYNTIFPTIDSARQYLQSKWSVALSGDTIAQHLKGDTIA